MSKASITGSIVGNLLFVLGLSFFLGGWKREKQEFNRTAAGASGSQLALAIIGLLIPAAFYFTLNTTDTVRRDFLEQELSFVIAALLIVSYVIGLIFSLRTHKHLYAGEGGEGEHEGQWSIGKGVGVLLAATLGVAVMSETLVASLEEAVHVLGWSELFVGVILIPVIGNAAEHLTAVTVAMKNKMDLSIGIAIGSSTQIALFVAPLLVFVSLLSATHMNLLFNPFELVAIGLAVFIVNLLVLDGESNWYEGVQLLLAYAIIAIAFFFHD